MNDLRFGFRLLVKSPGFTLAAVLSLALGIGANTTVMCWLQALVLRPLPGVARQEEVAVLVSNYGGGGVSLPDLRDFARAGEVFAGAAASMTTNACLTVERQPEWLAAQVVTADFFSVLDVKPLLGRTFLPGEDQKPGGDDVIVISERLWRRRFAADPQIAGRVVDVNRHAFTIVGVVPEGFKGSMPPSRTDLYAPASMIWEVRNQERYFLTRRTARGWHDLVRLRPGVTLAQARAVVTTADARLAKTFPNENKDVNHRLVPLQECPWGAPALMAPVLRLLLAMAVGVHLIVVANVANLLLARGVSRRREVAIRMAAGASRARVLRQFVIESLLLAVIGGAAGVLAASWAVDATIILLARPAGGGTDISFTLDPLSLLLALGLTLVTGLVFGLVPAWQATRGAVADTLKETGRSAAAGAVHHRLRCALVVTEIALAVVLLAGAALCLRGLRRARQVDVGFNASGVLLAGLQIGMNGHDQATGLVFYRTLRERLAAAPGIEEAALASWFPLGLSGCKGAGIQVDGYQRLPGENPIYEFAIVSPRYFAAMQIPLVAGRDFTDADDTKALTVAIVNEHFARRFWPGQDPIGRKFRSNGTWRTVVGVAKSGRYNRIDEAPHCYFYLPYQQGVPDLDLALCVRTRGDPAAAAALVRTTVHQVDAGVEVLRTVTLTEYSSMVYFVQRMAVTLLIVLGAVAAVLAAMGVYAVMAYAVTQRQQEFGVRMALGAAPRDVLHLVVREGLQLALAGIAIGAVLAALVARSLSAFLYGVSPFDAVTFTLVPLGLGAVALVASLLPALRATRVAPAEALRAE